MKKSMQFKEAQLAVLSNQKIDPQDKLEILSTLMECESFELFRERQEEQGKTSGLANVKNP